MGYQTQKILELNQEEQRPIGVIRGAILINDSGQRFFQLKLKNNLPYTLQQVQVQIVCYNEDGMYIGAQNYTYQSLSVEPGEVFGTKQAIPVEFESTDSFSVIGEEMGEEPEEDISGELKDIWEEEQSSKRPEREEKRPVPDRGRGPLDWPKIVGISLFLLLVTGIFGVIIYAAVTLILWRRGESVDFLLERLIPSKDRTPGAWVKLILTAWLISLAFGIVGMFGYLWYRYIPRKKKKEFLEKTVRERLPIYGGILAAVILILAVLAAQTDLRDLLMRRDYIGVGFVTKWKWLISMATDPIWPFLTAAMGYQFTVRAMALLPLTAVLWEYNERQPQRLQKISLAYLGIVLFTAVFFFGTLTMLLAEGDFNEMVAVLKTLAFGAAEIMAMAQLARRCGRDCRAAGWFIPGQLLLLIILNIFMFTRGIGYLFMLGVIQALALSVLTVVLLVKACGVVEGAIGGIVALVLNIPALLMLFQQILSIGFRKSLPAAGGEGMELVFNILAALVAVLSLLLLWNMKKRGEENGISRTENI